MAVPGYLRFSPRIFFKNNVLPHYLVFFVTKNCTAQCLHCLLGKREKSINELTLDEIKKISYHMDPLLFLLITGGDPFIRNDIPEIVKVFYENPGFKNLGMPTNGYLTEKIVDNVEQILRDCPGIDFAVDVSIDGVGEDHDKIRGVPGIFEKAVNTYKKLENLQKKYTNFNLNVAVTVSYFNQNKLDDLYSFLTLDLGVKNINHLLCRGAPRDSRSLSVDMQAYTKFSERLDHDLRVRVLKGYHGYFFSDIVNAMKIVREKIIRRIREEDIYLTPCYAGRLGVVIYPNGDVMPCELRSEIMGNLREHKYDFREILLSQRAEEIRNKIELEKCRCTYECFLTNAVIFNPKLLSSVVGEVLRMKFTRWKSKEN